MAHGRKYGDKESRPLPIWNGILEHHNRIGNALWELIWCIDKITREQDGVGIVLGGSPVKLKTIVDALNGTNQRTVRRHMEALEKGGYIRRRRTPSGYVIEVLNSHKFKAWGRPKEKPERSAHFGHSEVHILSRGSAHFGRNKEDNTGTIQDNTVKQSAIALPVEQNQIAESQNRVPVGGLALESSSIKEKAFEVKGITGQIPDWVPQDAWEAFMEVRKAKRAPQTAYAIKLLTADLDRLRANGEDVKEVLEQSTKRGWTGVFTTKGRNAGFKGKPSHSYASSTTPEPVNSLPEMPFKNRDWTMEEVICTKKI